MGNKANLLIKVDFQNVTQLFVTLYFLHYT